NTINWGGIAYLPGSAGTLDDVTVQDAGAFYLHDGMTTSNYRAGILVSAASPLITNSTINSNGGNGIEVVNGGAPHLTGDTLTSNNAWAVEYDGATTALGNDSGLQASGNQGTSAYATLLDNGNAVRIFLPGGGASYSPTTGQPLTIPEVGLPLF